MYISLSFKNQAQLQQNKLFKFSGNECDPEKTIIQIYHYIKIATIK